MSHRKKQVRTCDLKKRKAELQFLRQVVTRRCRKRAKRERPSKRKKRVGVGGEKKFETLLRVPAAQKGGAETAFHGKNKPKNDIGTWRERKKRG